jgi:hypothetical protein
MDSKVLTLLYFTIKVLLIICFLRLIMAKKFISMEIPEGLALSLDELAKKTGRKKNLLLAVSLNNFLKATEEEQEKIIRKYLNTYRK